MNWIQLYENYTNIKKINDIVIVGGGISSLYCAWLIRKKYPTKKITIIEKEKECGGRVKMSELAGTKLPTGAFFSRLDKDKLLCKLLKDLKIDYDAEDLKIDYLVDKTDISPLLKKLKENINRFSRNKLTFEQFAKKILQKNYEKLKDMMGYTDYEKADFKDTLQNYGLEDNLPGYKISKIDWSTVVDKLIEKIGKENIILDTEVKTLKKEKSKWCINDKWEADAVIVAVTIKQLRKLIKNDLYTGIESQPFVKFFAQTEDLKGIVQDYTIAPGPLRKVIKTGKDIYNIAFSDNKEALEIKDKTKSFFEQKLKHLFNKDIKIKKLKEFFWDEGTHYFKPLSKDFKSRKDFIKKAQHPEKNLWVIGEVVALKQGWVEGALSSVHKISLLN